MSAVPTVKTLKDKTAGTVNATDYAILNGVNKVAIESSHHVINRGHKNVILVGAGVSGITQAAMMLDKRTASHEDMVIFDVQDNYGGVWEKNKYPGCACDVPSLLYTNKIMINTGEAIYCVDGTITNDACRVHALLCASRSDLRFLCSHGSSLPA